jgi:hypothetical protein
MGQFDQESADKIRHWAEVPLCPDCGPVLLPGMPQKFCCQPFKDRILTNLPRPMDKQSLGRVRQWTSFHPNFPRILNRDLRPVFQQTCVSSSNTAASNV